MPVWCLRETLPVPFERVTQCQRSEWREAELHEEGRCLLCSVIAGSHYNPSGNPWNEGNLLSAGEDSQLETRSWMLFWKQQHYIALWHLITMVARHGDLHLEAACICLSLPLLACCSALLHISRLRLDSRNEAFVYTCIQPMTGLRIERRFFGRHGGGIWNYSNSDHQRLDPWPKPGRLNLWLPFFSVRQRLCIFSCI